MPWCVVIGCRNNLKATKRAGKDVSYHIFPKNPERRSAWINILNRPLKFNADSSYICSEHFVPNDYECNSLKEELLNIKVKRQLKKTAIPSVNIPNSSGEELLNTPTNILESENPNQTTNTCIRVKNINEINMQQSCAVPICDNTSNTLQNTSFLFHKFPSDTKILKKWLNFCNIDENLALDYQNAVICSKHFCEESYEIKHDTKLAILTKTLKSNAVPTLNWELKIIDCQSVEAIERKKLVDKLLADYDEQQKNGSHLNNIVTKHPHFFSPKINSNAKLGDKLKLLKAINNSEHYCPPKKKKKISISSKSNASNVEQPIFNNSSLNKDQVIQVSAVKGGLMLHALPQVPNDLKTSFSVKHNTGEEDESEEIIIVTKDEANHVDLSSYKEQHKENNTEIIIVNNLKETEDTSRHMKSLPKNETQIYNSNSNCYEQNQLANSRSDTPLYTTKVPLSEEKGCQVSIPCGGCEHRSLKINKLLRERTRFMRDLNQNGTWKDPDEINTLKRMNGVLSLLLMQCVGEKNNKKSSSIRVDLVQDSIERVERGWSMQETSEALCQALSVNAYDEFARTFQIINEI